MPATGGSTTPGRPPAAEAVIGTTEGNVPGTFTVLAAGTADGKGAGTE